MLSGIESRLFSSQPIAVPTELTHPTHLGIITCNYKYSVVVKSTLHLLESQIHITQVTVLPDVLRSKKLYTFLLSQVCYSSFNLKLPDQINLISFQQYRLQSSSPCHFLHSLVNVSFKLKFPQYFAETVNVNSPLWLNESKNKNP